MKTIINVKKKNSFAKILGMKLADNREPLIIISVIFLSIVFVCFPLVFKQIPNKYVFMNLGIVIIVIFAIIPLLNLIISVTNSLNGMRYIPLNENEINFIGCDTVMKYVDFINEVITYNNYFFDNYRAKVPSKIISQVIEFGNTYYSSKNKIEYDDVKRKFIITPTIIKTKKGKSK